MPLISITSGGGVGVAPVPETDPHFASVVLLTHMDADPPVDLSDSGHTLTLGSAASLDTTNKKFGAGSIDMGDSTSGYVEAADSDDWHFADQPFTIECWARWASAQSGTDVLLSQSDNAANLVSWTLQVNSAGLLFAYSTNGSDDSQLPSDDDFDPVVGTWYHFAVDRDASDNIRSYIDGVVRKTANVSTDSFLNSSAAFRIGNNVTTLHPFDGNVDEVRITKGVARYGGAFVPRISPFPDA